MKNTNLLMLVLWANKYLLYFLIVIAVSLSNVIYLDQNTEVLLRVEETEIKVTGEYIDKLFTSFGLTSAFVVGCKLAAAFIVKHPMPLGGKIGITAGTGAVSSTTFHMINQSASYIKGIITAEKSVDDSIILHIKDVKVTSTLSSEKGKSLAEILHSYTDKPKLNDLIVPKFKDEILNYFDKTATSSVENIKFRIVEVVNKDSHLKQIFSEDPALNKTIKDISDSIFINSPLEYSEHTEAVISNFNNNLNTILSYNLTVNLWMIYLIILLIFIFTIKFVFR